MDCEVETTLPNSGSLPLLEPEPSQGFTSEGIRFSPSDIFQSSGSEYYPSEEEYSEFSDNDTEGEDINTIDLIYF